MISAPAPLSAAAVKMRPLMQQSDVAVEEQPRRDETRMWRIGGSEGESVSEDECSSKGGGGSGGISMLTVEEEGGEGDEARREDGATMTDRDDGTEGAVGIE